MTNYNNSIVRELMGNLKARWADREDYLEDFAILSEAIENASKDGYERGKVDAAYAFDSVGHAVKD